jgi:hypothetical protein
MRGNHVHIDAGAFSILLTLLVYMVKWIAGFKFPVLIFFLPTFVVIFFGLYIIFYIVFWIAWNRK